MSAADLPDPEHYNPLLVTVLPKERRSRHPYQLAAMLCLFTLGAWQLAIGTVPNASINQLDLTAFNFLNWVCVLAGLAGVAAAFIPERVVRMRLRVRGWQLLKVDADATYFRLWEEFGAHLMLFTIWLSYGQTVWVNYGPARGYSLGLAASICFGYAALHRAWQIIRTLQQAGVFNRHTPSAIVGSVDGEAQA